MDYINSIDFSKGSTTVAFEAEEEIFNTDESIIDFCKKLDRIIEHHSFVNKLSSTQLNLDDIKRIVMACDKSIVRSIDTIENRSATRDEISQDILPRLNDLCGAALLQNSYNLRCTKPNLQLAYEQAQLNLRTKYLANFLRCLKYIDCRIPEEGQSERLMLKYYNFMWQIRKYFWDNNRISILQNLEKFPLNTDQLDNEYYNIVAKAIESTDLSPHYLESTRFYVQKKTPFYVGTERYYEITLQLANKYATKFNRITVYSKQNISTAYSINIGYTDTTIDLWGIASNIKIITNWRVSIAPACLNKLGRILNIPLRLNASYGEYAELMSFLTKTGMTLLDIIDLQEMDFHSILDQIYGNTNTNHFREVIEILRRDYSSNSVIFGKNVVRYLLINLREKSLIDVMPNRFTKMLAGSTLYLASGCRPFERNPLLANLPHSKTAEVSITKTLSASGTEKINILLPYLRIRNAINKSGELYFKASEIASDKSINDYNEYLVEWEQDQGYSIVNDSGLVTISAYETITLKILQRLLDFTQAGIKGQKELNARFIKDHSALFEKVDVSKQKAIKYAFVNSRILLIYGAAGTGKTTLINYISSLMPKSKKLFLTKTHAAIQHLQRRIDNPGSDSDFICIDSFTRRVNLPDYDIIFVDECSTIDNRTMLNFIRVCSH